MIVRINEWLTRALLVVAATLAFLLSFLVVADVIGRVVFNHPVKGTPELVSISIVIVCFLQAGYAIRSGGMLHVEVVLGVLPRRMRSLMGAFGAVLGALFFALVAWGSIDPLVYAWQAGEYEGEGALRVPTWPARLAVLIGATLAALNYLLITAEAVRAAASRGVATLGGGRR